jgi:hypothetical protein
MRRDNVRSYGGFALYEVVLGVIIFVIGILALGRAVENCMNANILTADEERVRGILANRMAEIQGTPGAPDAAKKTKIDSEGGMVELEQKVAPVTLKEDDGTQLTGVEVVTLTANWLRGGTAHKHSIEFYVYRGI